MPQYKKAPQPSTAKRIRAWVQTPLGAGLVAGFVLLVIGYYFFNTDDSSAPAGAGAVAVDQRPEQPTPEDATEQAAQRPFWVAPPQTFPGASEPGDGVAEDLVETDLLVGLPKEIYEDPSSFADRTFYIVGRVVRQEEVPGDYYDREFKLVSGERGFSAFVGATDYLAFGPTGSVVFARGRLAAVGESQLPGEARPERSIYFLTLEENGGNVEAADLYPPSSGTLRRAVKRVKEATG